MEINILEMNQNANNKFNYNNFNLNEDIKNEVINKKVTFSEYSNYWDPKPEYEKAEPKKQGISYDDILNSMNMVVINGRLHFIPANKILNTQNNVDTKITQQTNYTNNSKNYQNIHKQINKYQQLNNIKTANDQKIKNNQNSFIYDNYLKNYQQEKEEVYNKSPKINLTLDEIKRRLILYRLKQFQEKKRIEQIKSKKLLFDTSNIHISTNQSNNPPNLNKLFRFSDR